MVEIDFRRIAEDQDLPAMLRRDGIEVRNGKALCPFHDNHATPALSLYRKDGCWQFKCHSGDCNASGDAIDYHAMTRRVGKAEAARELGRLEKPERGGKPTSTFKLPRPSVASLRSRIDEPGAWAAADWQVAADRIIREAAARLWTVEGRAALAWLRARGLADHTIYLHALGFVSERIASEPIPSLGLNAHGHTRRIFADRGIVLPWPHPEGWYSPNEEPAGPRWVGANVRKLAADVTHVLPAGTEKCWAFAGSHRGYAYPSNDLVPGLPVIICEGEWDALIAWQELGWIANIVTAGASKGEPKVSTLDALAACPHWLIATHNDPAGNAAAKEWDRRSGGKAIRLLLPPNRDLNDMHLDGISLRSWLREEYDLLDWPWPEEARP